MKTGSLKITTKLFLGFGIVVFFTTLLGLLALIQFKTLSSFTENIHEHPMVVSNAVRDIKADLINVQYNLELLFKNSSEVEFLQLVYQTNLLEDNMEINFLKVGEKFLGDQKDVDIAHATFDEFKPILNRIITLLQIGEIDEAIILKENHSNPMIVKLQDEIKIMSDFANTKSDEFYINAINTSDNIFILTLIILFVIILLSIFVTRIISMSITRPLNKLMIFVRKLSLGDQNFEIDIKSKDEIGQLSSSIDEMKYNLKEVVIHSKKIAEGNYTGEIQPRSNVDELAISLNSMTASLKSLEESNSYSDWLKSGQNLLNIKMRGDQNVYQLSNIVITTLSDYVGANVGAVYIYDSNKNNLKMCGSYAYSVRKTLNDFIELGEGLVGQTALEKKIISITDIPVDYIRIESSLGSAPPKSIVAIPLLFNGKLIGVLELGSFNIWEQRDFELFESLIETIGVSFDSCGARDKMTLLLKQQQEQAREMLSQQEELRASNEELEEKTERLVSSEERMRLQQEELKATNEELEEKTEFLENQRDEINKKNSELEIVKVDIMKKAEDLTASSRYKSEFLANMSHELRTPLNSLLILSKDLYKNIDGRLSDDDVKSAEIIYNSGNELLQLINEILDLAKIESGKIVLNIGNVSTRDLVSNIENHFNKIAAEKGIELNVTISDDIPSNIVSDEQKINQIIKNLVSNAIKFTNMGSVSINFKRTTAELRDKMKVSLGNFLIEVKDTGIGIPKDKLETVFDAFKQVDGSTSREFGGSGLGLSISRELALLLGGEIILESIKGKGSTFSLIMPDKLGVPTEVIDKGSLEEMEKIRHKSDQLVMDKSNSDCIILDDRLDLSRDDRSILIIENDRNFAGILQQKCKENSFKVIISENGEDGIILAEEFIPDAIILDTKLPGINGLQVLDYFKKSINIRHIPVHIISDVDNNADVYDKGVLGFLQKPFDKGALDKVFKQIFNVIDKKVKDLLIVEDDDKLRFAIEKLIGNSDVIKTSVTNGQDAFTELSKNKFNCMILDLSLPDFSGFELLEKLEKLDIDFKPPVIIYTGKEISLEEEYELRKYSSSIIIKGVHSEERLLDETSLFLHRVIKELPENKQQMISRVYDEERVFKGKTILIVDDDMRNVFAISKIIQQRGMIVEKAVNGLKALEILEKKGNEIDLVLMDIMMPVMDGYEAMTEIRKNKKYNSLPVLALTAKAMKEDRIKCIEAGANDYMTKPIDPERLLSLMRVWLYK